MPGIPDKLLAETNLQHRKSKPKTDSWSLELFGRSCSPSPNLRTWIVIQSTLRKKGPSKINGHLRSIVFWSFPVSSLHFRSNFSFSFSSWAILALSLFTTSWFLILDPVPPDSCFWTSLPSVVSSTGVGEGSSGFTLLVSIPYIKRNDGWKHIKRALVGANLLLDVAFSVFHSGSFFGTFFSLFSICRQQQRSLLLQQFSSRLLMHPLEGFLIFLS